MWRRLCLCFSHFYILFGILLVPIIATVYYVPQFTELPDSIVYINRDDSPHKLTCRAWPTTVNTTVKMYYVSRTELSLGMYPVHQNWQTVQDKPGEITLLITGNRMLDTLHTKQLHCIAKNEFGGLLSRPFEVVETFLTEFPPLPELNDHFTMKEGANVVLSFLTGNLAFLDCPAPFSQPPALLSFSRNGEVIVEQKSKNRYRYVPWSGGNGVSLLIYNVQQEDSGLYQCEAVNSRTLKKIKSSWQYRLDVKQPNYRIAPQVRRPSYGSLLQKQWVPSPTSSIGNGVRNSPDQTILLREGQNASLFCVIEASPVPSVEIYPHEKSNTGVRPYANSRTKVTDKFGVYQINNVQPSDAGKYICTTSDNPVASSIAQVKVTRRLNIINPPMDIALHDLGKTVRFSCFVDKSNTSGGNVITPNHRIQWYRNGLLVTHSGTQEGTLSVENVGREHLGIYQCVVTIGNEWISRFALLYHKNDTVLTKNVADQERPPEVKPVPAQKQEGEDGIRNRLGRDGLAAENVIPVVSSNTQFKRSAQIQNDVKISKPKTITLFANLAVLLIWKLEPSGSDLKTDRAWTFRVQMQRARHHTLQGEQEIVTQWTEPVDILQKLQMDKVFITKDITAGQIYRFRVVRDSTDIDSRTESPWTNEISFTHVGITPPVITNHTIAQNKVNIHWLYLAQKEFPVSHFSILIRKVNRDATSGKRGKADGYVNKTIPANLDNNNSQFAEVQLPKDEPYEVVILGQIWDPIRKLVRFTVMSQPINITLGKIIRPIPPRSGLESHMYMIYVVTIAGATTTLVILILLILCACHTCMEKKQARQRREDWLMNSSAVTNSGPGCSTMPPIYKDPAKLLHRENSLLLRYAATPPNGGDRVGDINGEQGNMNLHSAAAANLLNYPHEGNGTLGGGGINSSSFMLASLTSQNQHQSNQSHYQAGSYGSNRFQSLQRGASGGYQPTPSMAMMKREPPSGGDSVNDNMDGAGYNTQQQQQQQQQGGTLYHRGGPMSNSLAGSRLLLPHANSPPLTSTPMMAQAMSLQALHLASNQAQSGNHRDSMHLPPTNYMSSTTARGSIGPLSPLSPSGNNGAGSLSPQQQQLLAWQQQQQAMAAAAMLNYTNQGGQTPNNGYTGAPVSPMDMYYAAAAAHALRMQHAAAMQQHQAATLRQHHQGDGNESVYSYFSQPTHQMHHTLDGNSPSTGNTSAFFPQHMTLGPGGVALQQIVQNARPGSVQPPPTLQEQEEEQGVNANLMQSNGEMASNGTASISGRPPSSTGNHHHHHRRRRRKQPASGSTGQQNQSGQQLAQNQSHAIKYSASEENGELLDDEMGVGGGTMDGEDGVSTPDPHILPGGNLPPPPPPSGTNIHHGLDVGTDGRPMAQVQPMAPSTNYHAKYVNHGSFPPPVAQYAVGGHHPNTSLYQSHYHHPHPLYQNSLNRRGTPTLLVEPPRMRDYSEYGIPPNQVASTSAAPSDVEDHGGVGTELGLSRMNNGNARMVDDMGAGNRLSSTYLPPPPPRV